MFEIQNADVMKKRIIDIFNGIADGILPNVKNSISKNANDGKEINRARLTASILSFLIFIAMLRGWITWNNLVSLLKMIFTLNLNEF